MNASQHVRKTSKAGLAAIGVREGLRLKAYPDPATGGKPWTNGIGHTGDDVFPGQRITPAQAYRWLGQDVRDVEAALNELDIPAQRMYDALVSVGINLGVHIFDPSHDIGSELHKRHWDKAAATFTEYDVAGGRRMLGLLNRRKSERRQFLRGLAAYKLRLKAARKGKG